MTAFNTDLKTILLLLAISAFALASDDKPTPRPPEMQAPSPAPAEDISGMYSFLKEGEFVQITIEEDRVTGYISRLGDRESDRGTFLDQFFTSASVHDHAVAFSTQPIHGVWFEFKGRFGRGPAKNKAQDGYYVLRGTLTEYVTDSERKSTSRSREVEFRLLGQPQDNDEERLHNRPKSKH